MIRVRPAQLTDVPPIWEHLRRHGNESGRNGDLIFAPYEEPWSRPLDELQKEKETKWSRPVTEIGWERCWVLGDKENIYGELKLAHAIGLKTSLHRALLMMGIERPHRGNGMGKLLMEEAIGWARKQPTLDWIQLNVFAHNEPAKRLYQNFGFEKVGVNRDLFRVCGQKIDDIEMVLPLRTLS